MPEYLAPGVFVEETSFRAKSIEGVGTSTTGFVGPALRGPIGETPELLTSFGDFERIYGGLDDLAFGTNYLAHSVRGYFNEGGARLYVSRVAVDGSAAASAAALPNADPRKAALWSARSKGQAGNGTIYVRQISQPATRKTLESAPEGTLARVGGKNPPAPAQITGGMGPFLVANGSSLQLTLGGAAPVTITFSGAAAEVTAANALAADPINIALADAALVVTVGSGAAQSLDLHIQDHGTSRLPTTHAELLGVINGSLAGATASIDGTGKLTLSATRRGASSSITVKANGSLGFTADVTAQNALDANNNVADLSRVTADEINTLVQQATVADVTPAHHARVALSSDNRLILSTTLAGSAASLALPLPLPGTNSALPALGLGAVTTPIAGQGTASLAYYVKQSNTYVDPTATPPAFLDLSNLPTTGVDILTITVIATDASGSAQTFQGMGFAPTHSQYIGRVMALNPTNRNDALQNLFALQVGQNVTASDLRNALFAAGEDTLFALQGGSDGLEPTSTGYATALQQLEKLEDIAIVAAPGYSSYSDAQATENELLIHVENPRKSRYRIAVLDTPPQLTPTGAGEVRSQIDSSRAALYYPWIITANPLARPSQSNIPTEISLPPSGFISGIYARNDINRGVYKAPANEVVLSALRFESDINTAQQEVLNPQGVNCLRFFPGRGYRVWGARTASSDPEWKYVNVRRYFNYLEHSIDNGTQWAVFEPNGERLWANVRDTLDSFLYNEWVTGALLGGKPEEAFFVRCDRSTMTQDDLDNGRLICLIGVAVLKPAEFVIFRIGQMTADARS